MANAPLDIGAPSSWGSGEASGDKPENAPEDGNDPVGYTTLGSLLSSSFSAQDLRCLDVEKERQDVSSPRGVLEGILESEMDSSKTNSFESGTHCSTSSSLSHWRGFFNLWKRKSMKRLPTFPPLVPKISTRKSRSAREKASAELNQPEEANFCYFKSSWKNFTLSDLQNATNNFSQENLIGKGGYAEVYKGCLQNGQLVAIKRLTRGTQEERIACFLSEVGIIAHVNHPNTAKLIGYGVEEGVHLVIQLSPRGSLASVLHGSKEKLDWSIRYKIALGTADGLMYLHENCQRRIIHRDIKADNILLTKDYEPQICDFGLAKWLPKQWTHHNVSKFEGTFGYFAPEYFMHGIVDEKTDVYAFGVLLLELITGRRALDDLQQSLVVWAKPLLDDNNIRELVDPALGDAYDPEEMDRVVLTASLCIEQSPILRPRMSQVVILLRDDGNNHKCATDCQKRRLRRTYSEELLDAEEYNSTRYLKDLARHRQFVLGS
ncbi:receptor-like cytosolic serine/threonine-protein kinase RBK2 isoform X1 [Malania oleifera]|uniref:receptor-like cytosolic serine/threonine-protein kinase RBK2 isoform X1 n=1 Tax=Malania oleifera TaxID=397392 RepID=UPI0025AE8EF3|nr:receptor-like cytosolic serine/threonine-protein kinase RBK2 isoform X1 [Malania oleifera]